MVLGVVVADFMRPMRYPIRMDKAQPRWKRGIAGDSDQNNSLKVRNGANWRPWKVIHSYLLASRGDHGSARNENCMEKREGLSTKNRISLSVNFNIGLKSRILEIFTGLQSGP